jgi:hypothetical protein
LIGYAKVKQKMSAGVRDDVKGFEDILLGVSL